MAGTFPVLEDGQVCKYPVASTSSWVTRVNQFVDFSEQRWVNRQPLRRFVFQYKDISAADLATLKAFFETQKGMFDTFTVPFDGGTFENMVFEHDDFMPVEDRFPNRYSLTLRMKQTRPNGWFYTISGTPAYPQINGGIITQRPWTKGEMFFTSKIDLESGGRYSYAWRSDPLRKWELNYPVIEQSEGYSIGLFFEQMHGRMTSFDFDDPDLYLAARRSPHSFASPDPAYQAIPNCRFDMDEFTLQYVQLNYCSCKVTIVEVPS